MEMIVSLSRRWEGDIDSDFRLERGLETKWEFGASLGWTGLGCSVSVSPFPHL